MSLQRVLTKRVERRKRRIRGKIKGTESRPRLTVTRSNKHIYAQIIDDVAGKTLVSASDADKEIKNSIGSDMNKTATATAVGKALAERASKANIDNVVFDRNGLLYHGRIKSLADAAREAGLKF
jgi:large subunit ribosomal protein L18